MADLKNANPRAIEYFRNRGREYFRLREDLSELQISETDLGDLSIDEIKKVANLVNEKIERGGLESVDRTIQQYEKQVRILKSSLEDAEHTPIKDLPAIQRNLDSAETMLNLISMFRNILGRAKESKTNATESVTRINTSINNILDAINNKDGKGIVNSVEGFKKSINGFVTAMGGYESASEAYRQATLVELEELDLTPISLSDATKLHYAISKAIYDARQEQANDPAKAPEIERTISSLQDGLDTLEKMMGPSVTQDLRNKTQAKIDSDRKIFEEEDKKRIMGTFKAQLEQAFRNMITAVSEKYASDDWSNEKLEKLEEQKHDLVFNQYKEIPLEEKVQLDLEYTKDYSKKVEELYGKELFEALKTVEEIINGINGLNKISPEDKNLAAKVNAVMDNINKFKNSKMVKNGQVTVELDDNSVGFTFADKRIHGRKLNILSKEQYDKLHPTIVPEPEKTETKKPTPGPTGTTEPDPKKTTPGPTGTSETEHKKPEPVVNPDPKKPPVMVPPETAEERERKDIQYYLDLLRETNAKVAEINRINQELVFSNMFDQLSMANILHDVNVESTAVYASAIVTQLRLELSNKRYDYLKKYGKYILSNPEVKDAKIDEIKFTADFEDFLAKRDELIVDTELRIRDLNDKKPEGYEKEIETLLEFIKAQNSLIRRFLISESISKNIDVAAILSDRNARRKALLEQKLKDYKPGNQPVTVPETTPEPEAKTVPETQPEVAPETKTVPETQPEVKPETRTVPETQPEETFEPVPKGTKIDHVQVRETKLVFNPRNNQLVAKKISAFDRLFKNSPRVTTTLIKNGVRIELSKQLRERLAELSAKISLVNKDNKRVRTSRMVDADAQTQDITFKKDHDVNFDDYTVEVRIPGNDRSTVLFGDEEPKKAR